MIREHQRALLLSASTAAIATYGVRPVLRAMIFRDPENANDVKWGSSATRVSYGRETPDASAMTWAAAFCSAVIAEFGKSDQAVRRRAA